MLKGTTNQKKMVHSESEGAFLTQKGEKLGEVKRDINELETLLAGATQTSQSTLLLKKRKEMREVDESLAKTKRDYITKMNECEERRRLFEDAQTKMRERVFKFEKFITENDAKRKRAEVKEKQERKSYDEKVKQIAELNEQVELTKKKKEDARAELDIKSCYKVYLERIVEEGDYGYEEITEILNRHKTLVEANADLMTHSSEQERKVDECRVQLQEIKTRMQNEMLVLNSNIQRHQKELEKMRDSVKREEEEKHNQEDKKKDTSRDFSQVLQSIRNIFMRCAGTIKNKSVFVPTVSPNIDIVEQLDLLLETINIRITDLIEIRKDYQLLAEEATYAESTESHLLSGPLSESSKQLIGGSGFVPLTQTKLSTGHSAPLTTQPSKSGFFG